MGIPRNLRDEIDDESTIAVLEAPPLAAPLAARRPDDNWWQPKPSAEPTALAAEPTSTVDYPDWAVVPPNGTWWQDPGNIALSYDELMRVPTVPPTICGCGSAWHWESIAGGMSCIHCERIPSFSVLKDFWKAVPADEPNADGTWSAVGWERWFPKVRRLEQLFAHILAARKTAVEKEAAASGF